MKKNTIAVDIIAFGDLDDETTRKVQAFHDNIKGSADGSNLAIIPPGPNLLSDSIIATPILAGEGMGPNMGGGGAGGEDGGAGGDSYEFGVDPNADPELALALRMSMEEEERRKAREDREKAEAEGKTNLESVPEEGGGGGASGSGGGDSKKDDAADPDKMDTA